MQLVLAVSTITVQEKMNSRLDETLTDLEPQNNETRLRFKLLLVRNQPGPWRSHSARAYKIKV